MKPHYEVIEHTADVGIKVYGKTLKDLFVNSAKGMFHIISGDKCINEIPRKARHDTSCQIASVVKLPRNDQCRISSFEELLVDWLSELLYIFNKERLLFIDFKISRLDNTGLSGTAFGDKIDFSIYPLQTEIKAVTFHRLKIEKNKDGFGCSIIFDV